MINKRLIVAATGKDVAKHLPKIFENIKILSKMFNEVRCVFTESDSSDNTFELMQKFNEVVPTEAYTLGRLADKMPLRVGRIAAGRNVIFDIVEKKYSDYDLLLFLDIDEINSQPIEESAIVSCFALEDWDMMCANQTPYYYDLWALRHPVWMPFDCWEALHHRPRFINYEDGYNIFVKSRFIQIPEDMPFIQVQSAFGGAAFIKIASIKGARSYFLNGRNQEMCDWPSFCQALNGGSAKIFINPRFVNQRNSDVNNVHVTRMGK